MHIRNPNPHLPFGDNKEANWYGKDIISVNQFNREDLEYIFGVAHEMRTMVERVGTFDLLKGKILANLFYEPSTRTSSSFTRPWRPRRPVIPINEVILICHRREPDGHRAHPELHRMSSSRHPETGSNRRCQGRASRSSTLAMASASTPRALLDVTISRAWWLDDLNVTMLGLTRLTCTAGPPASKFRGISLDYVSPDILRMPREVMDEVTAGKVPQAEHESLAKPLPATDVLYVTRVQKERFEDPAAYEKVKGAYVIDPGVMKAAKQDMIVMHPLPRVTEISMEFDEDPRAAYFRQMEYGLYVRMALLAIVLGKA
jgi:aspartate carbamoyltransferase catalytic subunit